MKRRRVDPAVEAGDMSGADQQDIAKAGKSDPKEPGGDKSIHNGALSLQNKKIVGHITESGKSQNVDKHKHADSAPLPRPV